MTDGSQAALGPGFPRLDPTDTAAKAGRVSVSDAARITIACDVDSRSDDGVGSGGFCRYGRSRDADVTRRERRRQ